jgi:hypothetical protein
MAGKPIGPIKKGQMHRDLGKAPDAPITQSDIAKEKAKGGVFAKRAQFAENAKHFHHAGARSHMSRMAHSIMGKK